MKKLLKLSLLIFIPIIIGFALLLSGIFAANEGIRYAGIMTMTIGVPVCMFIVVVTGLVLMIIGRLGTLTRNQSTEEETPEQHNLGDTEPHAHADMSEREREETEVGDINSSYSFENSLKTGDYHARHVSRIYKNSSKKEKILGWLFFALLMIDFALILVFAYSAIYAGAIVCFVLFAGTIVAVFIVKSTLEKRSLKGVSKSDGAAVDGVIQFCVLSSTRAQGVNGYEKLTGVIYRVKVTVQGKDYNAYTERFYEEGEKVKVVILKGNLASVVED